MSKHLAKDKAVWNRLMFGMSRASPDVSEKQPYPELSEKSPKVAPKKGCRDGKLLSFVALCGLGLYLICARFVVSDYFELAFDRSVLPQGHVRYGGYVDDGSLLDLDTEPKEIIAVLYPFVPRASYGKPVHSALLINHTFDSWGHPSLETFVPKDVDFNKVVLTLNTTVDGVQYDRLAHLYVGGAEIWRTSTIEPGHAKVFSSFSKDVSDYASLFKQKTDILFQLDNLLTDRLTGAFHVELTAQFFLTHHVKAEDSGYQYFDIRKTPNHVLPLVKKDSAKVPPIESLPSHPFSVTLPKVAQNTTRLKLSIFASGNGQEEFWYNNVLDRFTHRFDSSGVVFFGHGPLRFVNVWVDGEKVASQTPQPFIFTGGFSPALWNSVVANNAFDLSSIDLDISGLLPLLWDGEEHTLSILVDNGLDEVDGTASGIGNDWIISANILTYENAAVAKSSARIVEWGKRNRANSIGISLPYGSSLQQITDGIFETDLSTEFITELKSGEVLNNTLRVYTKGELSNVQLYSKMGKTVKVVHVGHSAKRYYFTDNVSGELVHLTDISISYPLTISNTETPVDSGVDIDVQLVNVKETELKINEKLVMKEIAAQNGTSTFHIRSSGNYGVGALQTKFKSLVSGPTEQFKYKRVVNSENGQILSDKHSYKELEN